jgi:hypothetical protein
MRYFTVKDGALVTRFGTGTYLGATVAMIREGERKGEVDIKWTGDVVALPDAELNLYLREYNQLLAEGSLVEVKEEAYKKFLDAQEAQSKKEAAAIEETAKKEAAALEAAQKKADAEAKAAAEKAAREADAAKKKADDAAAKAANTKTEG